MLIELLEARDIQGEAKFISSGGIYGALAIATQV